VLVFTPISLARASQLRSGVDHPTVPACAATPALLSDLGSDVSTEEAEYVALSNAGVLALVHDSGPRLVLAADVQAAQLVDRRTAEGEVEVTELRWSQVTALFTDEPAAADAVGRAREAAAGSAALGEVLASPAVTELLESFDLLWYAVEELDDLG